MDIVEIFFVDLFSIRLTNRLRSNKISSSIKTMNNEKMAGTKESAQARQRKEERRQAFYRSLTERAQKERTSKGTEQAGSGVGPAKETKGNNEGQEILTCDPAMAALPRALMDQQQVSFQAKHASTENLDQSVFALQMRLRPQEQAQVAQAASFSLPASNLYTSSYMAQRQILAAALHLQQQQQDRQRLLMAHRQELLGQRQRARAVATVTALSQATAAGHLDALREEDEENAREASSTSSRANKARSALALLMQQQRRIQDLEQKLALTSSSPSVAAAGAAAAGTGVNADDSASKISKTAVVVDLCDEGDDEDGHDTMSSSSHSSSLSSTTGGTKHQQQQQKQSQQMQAPGVVAPAKQQDLDEIIPPIVPPLSAYALFLKDEWTKITRHAKANNRTVNPSVLVQAIATKWKALDQTILIRYAVLASQDKERYQRECAAQAYYRQQQQLKQQHVQF
jgi:HMG-box domain